MNKECQVIVRKSKYFKSIMLLDRPTTEFVVEEPSEEEEGDVDVKGLTRLLLNASTVIKWITFSENVQKIQKERQILQKLRKKYC